MNQFVTRLIVFLLSMCAATMTFAQLPLIPSPRSVQPAGGNLSLAADARIVAADPLLSPLAVVLADEIARAGGPQLQAATGVSRAGDIVLKLDDSLKGEAYRLVIDDRATITAGNYAACAMGTVTLLQSMSFSNSIATAPHVTIEDAPSYGYRGLMIDVAREHHSIDSIEQVVELCRLYKVRYLQLHLTDDQAFTFPSTAFPQISSKNWNGPAYGLDELKSLVKFADDRGVAIIPELEAPGHCGAMQRAMPETFGMIGADGKEVRNNCFNFMNPKAYPAMETLVGEMCDVFKSSPYFHIGSDEAWLGEIGPRPETQQYLKDNNLDGPHELYMQYIVKMNEIVKKHNKQTIVWEGFGGTGSKHFKIPTDVVVMEFEVRYNLPQDLVRNGYSVINAAWTPLYVVNGTQQTPENIFGWDIFRFGQFPGAGWSKVNWTKIDPTPKVTGAQMCTWEQPEWLEVPSLRSRLPAMSQRIWNSGASEDYAAFSAEFAQTDALLDKLLYGFSLNVSKGPGSEKDCQYIYSKAATVQATPLAPGLKIRYTLDGKEPTSDSPELGDSLQITEKGAVKQDHRDAPYSLRTTLRARAFNDRGPAGATRALFFDSYDYLDRLPKAAHVKIFENPAGSIARPDLASLKLLKEIDVPHVFPNDLQGLPETGSVLQYTGQIDVPADGEYEVTLRSNDGGAQLYINDQLVCDRSGKSNWDNTVGTIKLPKGPAAFKVECYLQTSHMFFSLSMTDPPEKKALAWDKLLVPFQKQ